MAKNYLNQGKETDIQLQKIQRVPNKVNPKRPTPKHILVTMAKVKYKDNLEGSKIKMSCIQIKPYMSIKRFLISIFISQKGVERHF